MMPASLPASAGTTPATPPAPAYVRATGNLKGAQRLLGHSRIETTTRYAHVLLEDIRAGQEAVEAARTAASAMRGVD